MNKFWIALLGLIIIGLFSAYAAGSTNSNLTIYDLETECREDRETRTNIQLQKDNSFSFEGYFPVEDPASNMRVDYKSGKNIVLNVKSQDRNPAEFLWNDCLASGVYDLETQPFEEGRYSVEVKHNGERVEKRIVQIKN